MKKSFDPSNITTVFILISALVSLFYLCMAGQDIRVNSLLDKKTEAHITRYQIDGDDKGGKFTIGVFYEYFVDNIKYEGQTIFSKRKFLNYYAALDAITKLAKEHPMVSYSSKELSFSKLDHHFKIKNSIYFSISAAVFLYFFMLRRSIKKFE
jgi:hypothetical protein